jgi:hypothetical protein
MFAAVWGHCISTVGIDYLFPMVVTIKDDQQSAAAKS